MSPHRSVLPRPSDRPWPTIGRRLALIVVLALVAFACAEGPPAGGAQAVMDTGAGDGQARPSTWQPWTWDGWTTFPSLYFAAEPEGFLSDAQMAKVSRFSLAIIEFRAGQFVAEQTSGRWADGDLAGFMEQQAVRLRQAHPDGPPVLTYRSGMWAGSMFSLQWDALQDQSLFIPDAHLCDGFIEYPMDVDESGFDSELDYCRWDYRNPATRTTYEALIASAAQEQIDGIFFDNAQSVVCDDAGELSALTAEERLALHDAALQTYRNAFTELVNNNKYPILSTTNGFSDIGAQVPFEAGCPAGEEATLAALEGVPFARNNEFWMWNLGQTAATQIRNSIREAERGVPLIVHQPYFPNDGGCLEGCVLPDGTTRTFTQDEFLEFGMAAFLVSMGPGSYFGFSDMQSDPEGGGWFDVSWDYHPQYDQIVTGQPLGPPEVSADGMTFTRRFERGTVSVNTADGTYVLDLSGDPGPPADPAPNTPLAPGGVDTDPATTDRAQFSRPVPLSIAVSVARFADAGQSDGARAAAQWAVLGREDNFADSLAGSPLTGRGPLLFSSSSALSAEVVAELQRVLPAGGTVYLLGGEAALSPAVEQAVVDAGLTPVRLAGPSRFETSVVVAEQVVELGGSTTSVIVARGNAPADNPTAAWADSVTGGAHAATGFVPVVVTPSEGLHDAVADFIEGGGATATLLGGTAALAPAIQDELPGSRRVAGAGRADTARLIATDLIGLSTEASRTVLLFDGFGEDGWAFGLAGAGLAADLGGALLVAGADALPPETQDLLSSCGDPVVETLLLGWEGVLSAAVAQQVDALDGSACG